IPRTHRRASGSYSRLLAHGQHITARRRSQATQSACWTSSVQNAVCCRIIGCRHSPDDMTRSIGWSAGRKGSLRMSDQSESAQSNAGQQAFSVISKTIQGESSLGQTPRISAEAISEQLDSARRHPLLTGLITLALTAAIGYVVAAGYRS